MSVGVPYMGTKRELSGPVARLVSDCRDGPLLDVFAGMCSVGTAVAPSRPIWMNDIQHFAKLVADTYFRAQDGLPDTAAIIEQSQNAFFLNEVKCKHIYGAKLNLENIALEKTDIQTLIKLFDDGMKIGQSGESNKVKHSFNNLFVSKFSGTYFGYKQSIDIDSIRYSIDYLRDNEQIDADLYRWLLLALCIAMSKCTTATGHFAQPLRPKTENQSKFISQRRRSVWAEWLSATRTLAPLGSQPWRHQNRSFNEDAVTLLAKLATLRRRPRVIYADPPYTKDQYSRYYHLYETVILYDYPAATGRGLYRPGRTVSSFSLRTKVDDAIDALIASSARMRADLILSYPANGLMRESRTRIPQIMKAHYRRAPEAYEFSCTHSTLGASTGRAKADVTEVIYRVQAK
jgi:adenine-specific DNA-methyltransferase